MINQISSVRFFHRWLAPTLKVFKKKKNSLPFKVPDPRKSYIEWNYEAELYAFGKRLGENFNKDLLRQALTEKSYLLVEELKQREVGMEPEIQLKSNDELVDEGHSFMEDHILKYLSLSLPRLPKQYILKIKAYLMSDDILAQVSKYVGVDDVILVPEDVASTESLSRGLKAVIRAANDDSRSERLVRDLVVSQLCGYDLTKLTTPDEPVDELEKTFKKMERSSPEFRLIVESAVNTLFPVYHVGAYCDQQFIGNGFGESLTIAKDMAACDALWRLWGISRRKPFNMDLELSNRTVSTQHTRTDVISRPNL